MTPGVGRRFASLAVLLPALASCGDVYFLGNLPQDAGDASNESTPSFGCDGCTPPAPFDPCAGKACGDVCFPCPNGDPSCGGAIADTFFCDALGACTTRTGSCSGGGSYVPCAGKTCGQSCTLCAPDDTSCRESAIAKTCGGDAGCFTCTAP
jgi:hypothetical protein